MVNESDDLRLRPHQEKTSSRMRDEVWSTQTCVYGWSLRGIWPEDADGTDINGRLQPATSHVFVPLPRSLVALPPGHCPCSTARQARRAPTPSTP